MTELGNQLANWYSKLAFALLILAASACPLVAQSTDLPKSTSTEEEIRFLRAELMALRTEVNSLKEELHRGAGQNARITEAVAKGSQSPGPYSASTDQTSGESSSSYVSASTAADASTGHQQQSDLAETLGLLQSQVAELAQTKTESGSKMPVKIYGTIAPESPCGKAEHRWLSLYPASGEAARMSRCSKGSLSPNWKALPAKADVTCPNAEPPHRLSTLFRNFATKSSELAITAQLV